MADARQRTSAPRLMFPDEDRSRVFAVLAGSGDVLAIDTETDEFDRIELGLDDPRSGVYGAGGLIFLAEWGGDSVPVVDPDEKELVTTIDVGYNPWDLDISGDQLLVANWSGDDEHKGTVSTTTVTGDPSEFEIDDVVQIPATDDGGPWGVAGCEDVFFVTNDGGDATVKVTLDPLDVEVIEQGELPWDVECGKGGGAGDGVLRGVVGYGGADIDLDQRSEVTETVEFDGRPALARQMFGLSEIETIAYALDTVVEAGETNCRIDKAEFEEAEHLLRNDEPVPGTDGLTLDSGRLETVWEMKENGVAVCETDRTREGLSKITILEGEPGGEFETVGSFDLGRGKEFEAWGADVGPDGKYGYVPDMHQNVTWVVDLEERSLPRSYETGEAPRDAIVANGKLYVANSGVHTISSKDGRGKEFDYSEDVASPGSITIIDLETDEAETRTVPFTPTPAPTDTPTPTSSPTDSPTASPTATEPGTASPRGTTTTGEGSPGFGPLVALVGLGVACWRALRSDGES